MNRLSQNWKPHVYELLVYFTNNYLFYRLERKLEMFELEKEERQQRLQKRQERKLREQEEYQRKQRVRCVCIGGIHTLSHETQGTKLEERKI